MKAGSLSQALMEKPDTSQFLIHCEWLLIGALLK